MCFNKRYFKILENKDLLTNKDYEILFVTGNSSYDEINSNIGKSSNIKVVPYIKDMPEVLKFTDIIVSRAGATTISEILSLGLVSILIPSPYVANNHQYLNALSLKNNDACILMEEKDFDMEKLIKEIDTLLNNKEEYNKISNNAKKLGVKNSATLIYNEIKKLTNDK